MSLSASLRSAAEPPPATGPAPEPPPDQDPVTPDPEPAERANVLTRAWRTARATWREGARKEGGWVNDKLRWAGPSAEDQRGYLRGRSWVEPGHEGGLADRAGEAYHVGIAIPAVAALNAAKAAAHRPFVAAWTGVVFLPVLFFALRVAGVSSQGAGAVCGVLIAVPLAWTGLIMLALAGYRERQRKRSEKK
jgi:hypothetical protein